ncbi:MAG: hypothetical protein AAB834_01625, partial [Patescibacteria group bacterium]
MLRHVGGIGVLGIYHAYRIVIGELGAGNRRPFVVAQISHRGVQVGGVIHVGPVDKIVLGAVLQVDEDLAKKLAITLLRLELQRGLQLVHGDTASFHEDVSEPL